MKTTHAKTNGFQEALLLKEAELLHALRARDDLSIEQTADLMDDIREASEKELAIRNMDSRFNLLREVRAALERIQSGSYGTCVECEAAISHRRLAAVPWSPRCVQCQALTDAYAQERADWRHGNQVQAA
jgi:DnaK suppressor protein